MPKAYSQKEKDYIRARLQETAAELMARYGIRRTTVDELVREVNIPKGTFYLFYSSKEELLYEVLMKEHESIETELMETASSLLQKPPDEEAMTELLLHFFKQSGERPVLRMLNSDEVELLARKLPDETFAAHLHEDDDTIEKLFSPLLGNLQGRAKTYSAAFRAVYFATLHQKEIGEAQYEGALRVMIRGLVLQLFEEAKNHTIRGEKQK